MMTFGFASLTDMAPPFMLENILLEINTLFVSLVFLLDVEITNRDPRKLEFFTEKSVLPTPNILISESSMK